MRGRNPSARAGDKAETAPATSFSGPARDLDGSGARCPALDSQTPAGAGNLTAQPSMRPVELETAPRTGSGADPAAKTGIDLFPASPAFPRKAENPRPEGGPGGAEKEALNGAEKRTESGGRVYPLLDNIEKNRGRTKNGSSGIPKEALLPAREWPKVERFGTARKRTLEMSSAIPGFLPGLTKEEQIKAKKAAAKLEGCGSYLAFQVFYTVDVLKLLRTNRCRNHMLCPSCAIIRGGQMMRRYTERIGEVRRQRPDLECFLITLTVKNGPDLEERMRHIRGAFNSLNQKKRDFDRGKGAGCFLNAIEGGVLAFEITNKGSGYHPHIHLLAMAKPGTLPDTSMMGPDDKQATEISKEWKEATGDSFIIDCRPIYENRTKEGFDELLSALLYITTKIIAHNVHA